MTTASAAPNLRVPLGANLTLREKLLLMGALMLCMFLTALDQSIVATAIPHILADLGGFDLFAWVITTYLLTSTVAIPVVGKLSDMFGRKPFILAGVTIFVLASAACGAAPTMILLIISRGAQGIGSGIIIACVFASLGDIFTPVERAKYVALLTGMFMVASLAGPAAGGFLSDGPGWRWCFYINLPIAAIAATFIGIRFPWGGGTGGRIRDIDFVGAALITLATVTFMLAIVWASGQFGWRAFPTEALGTTALVSAVLFVMQEQRHPHAIIPLGLFRNVAFSQSILITVVAAGGIFAATQFLPTYVQTSLGRSAASSGLVITPQAIGQLIGSLTTGFLVSRTGRFKYQVSVGALGITTATVLLHGLTDDESPLKLAGIMVVLGMSSGLVFPVTQVLVQGAVSQDQQGIAASTRQFFLLIAQTLGVAVLGLVLTTSYARTFTHDSTAIAAAIPPTAYTQFKDPTLALDPVRYTEVKNELRQTSGGEALLANAIVIRRTSVATAIDNVYAVSLGAGIVVVLVAFSLREITLRRNFGADQDAAPELA